MWAVLETPEYQQWRDSLSDQDKARLLRLQQRLATDGPQLGRPHVDSVSGSKHSNMKELRPSPTLRGFFAFDSERRAILLCGGDKAGAGNRSWYKKMIRRADALFDRHAASE
ncbi:type II toxin-antitoxin system RelE/ParE family toxin [Candidatus Poriferisodalis sp.]|uniref:type II toxin-antitoxin system RelE/ParE family toxin n=1 Tax=Candidatus Poriferisodalis sp. TaxID=3101277 RepID=UPI003D13A867